MNAYYFYKGGWRGIDIDAMPGSMVIFDENRQQDINLEITISNSEGGHIYCRFNDLASNGFTKELTEERSNALNPYYVVDEITLKSYMLSDVLQSYIPENVAIDFMTIDVEGLDFEVLKSNDWKKYRPKIVLVEVLGNSIEEFYSNEILLYLKDLGYIFYAKTVNTVFFRRKDFNF